VAFLAGQKLRASHLGQLSSTAQYQAAVAQSIPDSTATPVAFGTADVTSSLVARATSGAGHKFTLGASGLWSVTTTVQFAANGTGERRLNIEDSLGLWHCSQNSGASAAFPILISLSFTKWLAAGDFVQVEVYQTSTGALNIDANSLLAAGRINLACHFAET
jgi:hypothetical protein